MSSNRSVQRAIQRKAGGEPQKGPNTSINSSQVFSRQPQQIQHSSPKGGSGIDNINKMTVAQAISLITLRLGALESKVLTNSNITRSSNEEDITFNDANSEDIRDILQSIQTRLENVETKETISKSSEDHSPQIDTINKALMQTKNGTLSNMKDIKELKNQISDIKQDMKSLALSLEEFKTNINDRINNIIAMSLTTGFDMDSNEETSIENVILENVENELNEE
jgi:hypothetical protein